MKKSCIIVLLGFVLPGILVGTPVQEENVNHADVAFRVVRTAPDQVELVWKDEKGEAFRNFDKVWAAFAAKGKTVRFLMNAGIFEMGGTPCGLHVENGKTLHPLNLDNDEGNFFLKPNGVCWIESHGKQLRADIAESAAYQKRTSHLKESTVITAVQSGPLLLIDGNRHPAFRDRSPNKLHRNGVGVDAGGRLVFAITDKEQWVNLWDFAGLFLKLGCQQALFLDGDISKMVTNPDKPVASNPFGAMFVITE